MTEWLRVVYAFECEPCDMCGEPICPECHDHYADCPCPGPQQEDEYDYTTINGVEVAAPIEVHND